MAFHLLCTPWGVSGGRRVQEAGRKKGWRVRGSMCPPLRPGRLESSRAVSPQPSSDEVIAVHF